MKFLSLAWNINKLGKKIGGNTTIFSWLVIEKKLIEVLESSGTLTIDAEDDDESPYMLQVRAEHGAFLITLGMETSNGWTVKTFDNSYDGSEKVAILGDMWSKKFICYNKEIITEIFKCFYVKNKVNENLWTSVSLEGTE